MPVPVMRVPAIIEKRLGNDIYGQPQWDTPKKTVCAVVSLNMKRQKTTVRTDASGTRGHADEMIATAKLLLKKDEKIDIDDFIQVNRSRIRVLGITERYTVMGVLDHLEVDGSIE